MDKQISLKEYGVLNASGYDKWHRRNRYYYGELMRWAGFNIPEGFDVFELGMGNGSLAASLKPRKMAGIELVPDLVSKAKEKHPSGYWIEGDACRDKIEGRYDYIVGCDFLCYVEDIQGVLDKIRGICHSKSRLLLTNLNPFWNIPMRIASWLGLAQPRRYANWFNSVQLSRFLALADFEVIRSGKILLFPLKIPVLSQILNRYVARLPLIWRLCAVEYLIARPRPTRCEVPPSLTVVIPARNESGNIRAALERMPKFPGELEVVFVEGNSTDDTWKTIQEVARANWSFAVTCVRQDGKGKGDAVRKGFAVAKGDLLMILDADLTVPPEALPRFYNVLADFSADYVQGTRLVYPMEDGAMRPLNWLGNKTFGIILSTLLGQRFSDTLCGTKCLWREDYLKLAKGRSYFGNFDPFGDFDLIFGSAKLNLKMQEVPVHYRRRVYGDTNINRIRDGWLLIRMCAFAARKMYFV